MLKLNQLLPVGTENLSQRQRGSVPQPFYFDGLLNMAAGADACMWAPTRRCRAPRRLSQPAADNHLKTGDLDHLIASRTPPLFFNPAPPQVSIIRRAKNGKATGSRPCGDIAICGRFLLFPPRELGSHHHRSQLSSKVAHHFARNCLFLFGLQVKGHVLLAELTSAF